MKLSKRQQQVMDLMEEGWELGLTRGYRTHAWLQKEGLGKGGESEHVNINTFNSLALKNLIVVKKESFPTTSYKLNDVMSASDEGDKG